MSLSADPTPTAATLSALTPIIEGEETLLDRAAALQPLVSEYRAANEQAGRLSDPVFEALCASGLPANWVPRALGGAEADPIDSIKVIETLAYADPSTAWVCMALNLAVGAAGAYLPDEAVATLFADGRYPLIAGQGTRPGEAEATEGGFLLSGSWSFGSGLLHSSYIHTLGKVASTGETRIFIVPVEQATLDLDSWNVMGLRATGSIDYRLESVFVPAEMTYVNTTQEPLRGGPFYRLGIQQFALIGHTGWALGVGRRLLDDLAQMTAFKAGRVGQQAHSDAFESGFALAEAKLRAARALILEAWGDVWASLERDGQINTRQQTLIRLALHNVTWSAQSVSEYVYRTAGTTALRAGAMQQFFRDMHAGTQHITSSDMVLTGCGRELLGLDPTSSWSGPVLSAKR
jgi:alkylation response protein AidB-like acyl-CoA dehydrogenase